MVCRPSMNAHHHHNDHLQYHPRYVAGAQSVPKTTGNGSPITPPTKRSKRRDSKNSNTPPPPKRHLVLLSRLNKLMKPSDTASWVRSQPAVFQGKETRSPLSLRGSAAAVDKFRIVHMPDTTPLYSPPTPINPRTEHECEKALTEMFERAKGRSKIGVETSSVDSRGPVMLDDMSSIHTVDSSRDDESDSTVTIRAATRDEGSQKNLKWLDRAGALHTKSRRPPVPPPPPPLIPKISVFPPRYVQSRTQVKSSSNKPGVSHLKTIPGSPVKITPTAPFEQKTSRERDPMTPGTPRTNTPVSHGRVQRSSGESVTHLHAPRLLSERALLTINTRPKIKHEGFMQNRLSPLWSSSSSSSSSAGFRTHQSRPSVSSATEVLPRLRKTPSRLQVHADRLLRNSSSRPASRSDTIANSPCTESDEESIRRAILSSATFGHARRSKERRWSDAKGHVCITPSRTRLVVGSELYETSAKLCDKCGMQYQPGDEARDHVCVDAETPSASPQKDKIVITPTTSLRSFEQSKTELSPQSPSSVYTTSSSRGGSSSATPGTPHGWSAASTPTHQGCKGTARSSGGEHAWCDSMQLKVSPSPPPPRLHSSSSSQIGLSELDLGQVRVFPSPPPPKLPVVTPIRHEPFKPVKFHLKRNVMCEMSQGTARLESRRYGNSVLHYQMDEDGENADTMKMLANESEGERLAREKKRQEAGGSYGEWFSYYAENEVPRGVSFEAKASADPNVYEQILSIYDMYTDDLEN